MPHLTSLEIKNCSLRSSYPRQLYDMLIALPQLRTFTWMHMLIPEDDNVIAIPDIDRRALRHLRSIQISSNFRTVATFLQAFDLSPSVKLRLAIWESSESYETPEDLLSLVSSIGENLAKAFCATFRTAVVCDEPGLRPEWCLGIILSRCVASFNYTASFRTVRLLYAA
ncbi:hypothetical protein K474DRAFT_666005 [Panus rudis PR-1116 ss-1]|nr:hypothetical protein K474DRAFT_666005 [Panus rudis PR-1116 ss-1]